MNEADVRTLVGDVLERIAPGSDLDTLDPKISLREQLDLDSLDFLVFVENISRRSGKLVEEVDYPTVDTVSGCVEFFADAEGAGTLAEPPPG